MWRATGLAILLIGMMSFSVGFVLADARATASASKPAASGAPAMTAAPASPPADSSLAPTPDATPAPVRAHPAFDVLARKVSALIAASGGPVGVSLVELGGVAPTTWGLGGSTRIDAASTYKLPALIEEGQLVAQGSLNPAGRVCFTDKDWEDGWFDDYSTGRCYTRTELAERAGLYSDNTAGHMLVRDLGGAAALNAYAASLGARNSIFFDSNMTTADDLARLMTAEATGAAGGAAAQSWLYPRLTGTRFEMGIPAGVPAGILVVHKTGELAPVVDDAAIISGSPNGPYVLAVMTDGPDGNLAWPVIAQISAAVWSFEAAR